MREILRFGWGIPAHLRGPVGPMPDYVLWRSPGRHPFLCCVRRLRHRSPHCPYCSLRVDILVPDKHIIGKAASGNSLYQLLHYSRRADLRYMYQMLNSWLSFGASAREFHRQAFCPLTYRWLCGEISEIQASDVRLIFSDACMQHPGPPDVRVRNVMNTADDFARILATLDIRKEQKNRWDRL